MQERFYSRFSAGDTRRRAVAALLGPAAEAGSRAAAMAVLRAHAVSDPQLPGKRRNVCSHDGDIMGNPTTASMLVEYPATTSPEGKAVLWFTGASYACSNLYKPMLLSGGTFTPLWTAYDYADGAAGADAYWLARRQATRRVRRSPAVAEARSAELVAAQQGIFDVVESLPDSPSGEQLADATSRIDAAVAAWDSLAF